MGSVPPWWERCAGRWLPLGLTVDPLTGLVLTIDELTGEDAQTLKTWMEPIAAMGAESLVTDSKAFSPESSLVDTC